MSERLYYYFWCDTISSEWIYEHILLNVLSRIINNLKVLNVIKINDAIFVLLFEIVRKFYFLILLYGISNIIYTIYTKIYTIISPIQFGTNWVIMNTSLQKHSDVWIFYYICLYSICFSNRNILCGFQWVAMPIISSACVYLLWR